MLVEALLFITVALGIGYLLYGYLMYKPSYVFNLVPLKQSDPQRCIVSDPASGFGAWNANTPCTVRFFLFLNSVNRTQQQAPDCTATPYLPGCPTLESGSYKCTTDCTTENETIQNSYLKSIFKLDGGTMEFMVHDGVTNEQASMIPAYLKVKTGYSSTGGSTDKSYLEGVSLPAVPLQSWTMITIAKDGKRIDIFYNSKRVASKVLQYPPIDASLSTSYMCGNPSTEGTIGYTQWSKGVKTREQIAQEYTSLTNTKGVPRAIDAIELTIPDISSSTGCMFGTCNPMPAVGPANPFSVWNARAY